MYPNIPIIAQTAYSTDNDKRKALNAGCSDFISKPLSLETIQNIVTQYLDLN